MRDTDRDWNAIAERAPFYGVISIDKFLNPDPNNIEEFYQLGEQHVAEELDYIRSRFPGFSPSSALDFGCGVGRLAIPMAKAVGHVCGVDVADRMLDLARKRASEIGLAGQTEFTKAAPTDRRFDWVNTFIVLQHIPPAVGYSIIANLWNCVSRGGLISLHVTTYKDARMSSETARELGMFNYDGEQVKIYGSAPIETGHLSMFDYDLSRVFGILNLPHNQTILMKATDHGGCHGFIIYANKPT